jgi:hypothetical protein
MATLVLCASCDRHVRSGDACPFCGTQATEKTSSPLARTSRAVLLSLAAVACNQPAQVQPYGAPVPPDDAAAPATSQTAQVTAYGGPPTTTAPPPEPTPKH